MPLVDTDLLGSPAPPHPASASNTTTVVKKVGIFLSVRIMGGGVLIADVLIIDLIVNAYTAGCRVAIPAGWLFIELSRFYS